MRDRRGMKALGGGGANAPPQPMADRRGASAATTYVHFDVDYFFAQVEEVRDPSLREAPLGVRQHMEVASVNYKAREFGLYNRISVAEAKRLCPTLVLVRGDNELNAMQRYRSASQAVLRCIMHALDTLIGVSSASTSSSWESRMVDHPSFDDFYVLLEGHSLDEAASWAEGVRARIFSETGLRCSAGVARTKLLSLLATKKGKPNGQWLCRAHSEERTLLDDVRVDAMRGAGIVGIRPASRQAILEALGRDARVEQLREAFPRLPSILASEAAVAEVQRLLESMDDGSSVSRFVLPQSISVELSVREQDTEPCTVLDGIAAGYRQLAPMLLERARADERTYGPRKPLGLVAKWKLFPGASEVRQRQAPWPSSSMVEGTSAEQVSEAAYRLFVNANGSSGFRVSRLVLVMTYAKTSSSQPSALPSLL